jgi:Leucine-rich repeat (LRR) protein
MDPIMKMSKIITIIIVFMFGLTQVDAQCDKTQDSIILTDLFNFSQGVSWVKSTNWLVPGQKISTYFGITVNAQGCVESINLPNNQMNGFITPMIGGLKALKVLNLGNNQISGNLPASLGALSELRILNLSQNGFTASIPSGIGNLIKLEELQLAQNDLSGSIPSTFGNLVNLTTLNLSANRIFGSIPSSLGNLKKLKSFYADNNKLAGTIPQEIFDLTDLTELWLNTNGIGGILSPNVSKLTKLQKLLLNDNKISGPIPVEIGQLSKLTSLHLTNNKMTGPIPVQLGNCTQLFSLQLGHNDFDGTLPIEIGKMSQLATFDISSNRIEGEIPVEIGNCVNLKRIYMDSNLLIGCFPKSMKKFCPLTESVNVNTNGYNFRGNTGLFYGGDFAKWCRGEDVAKAVIQPIAPLCEGSKLELKGSGGISQSWSGPAMFTSVIATPVIDSIKAENFGSYFLYVVDANNCRDTASVQVKTIGNVNATVNGPICEGTKASFTANGGLSYAWTGPNNFTANVPNPFIDNAASNAAGIYTVIVKTTDCSVTKQVELKFVTLGNVSVGDTLCVGDTIKLSATLGTGQTIAWTGPSNFVSTSMSIRIPGASTDKSGDYTAVISDPSGCKSTKKVTIKVNELTKLTLADFPELCPDADSITLPLTVQGIAGQWQGSGLTFSNGLPIFNPKGKDGVYKFEFVPQAACTDKLSSEINVNDLTINATENTASNNFDDNNGSIIFQLNAAAKNINITYSSGLLSGTLTDQSGSGIIKDLPSGIYLISAVSEAGCIDTSSAIVRYTKAFYYVPNVVSINSTSNNIFYVKGENILGYDLAIYDRWGNLTFDGRNLSANDSSQGWEPKQDKTRAGVYVYKVVVKTLEGDKIISGDLTVI